VVRVSIAKTRQSVFRIHKHNIIMNTRSATGAAQFRGLGMTSKREKFYTREQASKGIKVFLTDMATGKLSNEWIIIRSIWSDEFQEAKEVAVQQAFKDAALENEDEKKAAHKARKLDLLVSLVAGWSFDEEFTEENIKEFLTEAVHLPDQIDKVSTQNSRFFGKASKP